MNAFEERLRSAMHDEATRVRPEEGLAAIRGRTATRSTARRGWLVPALSGLAAVALVVTGVAFAQGWPGGNGGEPTVAAGPSADSAGVSAESPEQLVTVWLLRSAENDPTDYSLYPRQVSVTSSAGPGVAAVEGLLAYNPPEDGDELNVWHTGVDGQTPLEVNSVEQHAGVVTVDFSGAVDNPWPDTMASWVVDPAMFSQQLVRTVQDALDTTDPVRVTQDGQPVDAVLTASVKQPIEADDEVLAPVYLTSPVEGATYFGGIPVSGESNTFEATVNWRVLEDGDVVDEGYAMGGSYGEWKPFRFRVELPAGSYTVEVFEASAKDGSQQYVNTRHVTVE